MTRSLCKWDKGDAASHAAELLRQLSAPKYYCKKCLRAAGDKGLLCKPQKLSKLG